MEFHQVKAFCSRCRENVSVFLGSDHRLLLWLGIKGANCPRCQLDLTGNVLENLTTSPASIFLASWIGRGMVAIMIALLILLIASVV